MNGRNFIDPFVKSLEVLIEGLQILYTGRLRTCGITSVRGVCDILVFWTEADKAVMKPIKSWQASDFLNASRVIGSSIFLAGTLKV